MGQMKKFIYIGAYIELGDLSENYKEPYEKFQCSLDGEDYDYYADYFIFPYQGLEGFNILLPHTSSWGQHQDEFKEHIWDFEYFSKEEGNIYLDAFNKHYSKCIDKLKTLVGSENVHIKCGIIDYWDERA